MIMKLILILLLLLLVAGSIWYLAIKLNKKGILEDKNNNNIPDIIEDKIKEVKAKAEKVKEVINKK